MINESLNSLELQRIEAIIANHPEVLQSLVTVMEDVPGSKKLIVYVVPSPIAQQAIQVYEWQSVFNNLFKAHEPSSYNNILTRNFTSWMSSYTGQPIPVEEMNEWVDVTLQRIRQRKPQKIVEIGCGAGLLLLELAQQCQTYVGCDISGKALAHIHQLLPHPAIKASTLLLEREAIDFSDLPAAEFDMVILNSVIQYFPNLDYLLQVLDNACHVLRPGGFIFLGDIRNLALTDTFLSTRALSRAEKKLTILQLRQRIQQAKLLEAELSIAPNFFKLLPRLSNQIQYTQVMLRRGRFKNEMSQFRYDVLLKVKSTSATATLPSNSLHPAEELSWQAAGASIEAFTRYLKKKHHRPIHITDIPNARVLNEVHLTNTLQCSDETQTIDDLCLALKTPTDLPTIDPETLYQLWENDYHLHSTWAKSGNPAYFDLIIASKELDEDSLNKLFSLPIDTTIALDSIKQCVNDPGKRKREKNLIRILEESINTTLPELSLPRSYVFLDKFTPLFQL